MTSDCKTLQQKFISEEGDQTHLPSPTVTLQAGTFRETQGSSIPPKHIRADEHLILVAPFRKTSGLRQLWANL